MSKAGETFPPAPFEGFEPGAHTFFRNLAKNQDKVWFAAHKHDYERLVRGPMQSLVADVSMQLAKRRLPLSGDPQKAVFRINRDVRFAKEKKPYKTHAGAVLTHDGRKDAPGLLYIHFDPAQSFVAAGFFRVEPSVLHKLRQGLVGNVAGWSKLERALRKTELAVAVDDDALVRLPKGFENAPIAVAAPLKLKSWIVRRKVAKQRLGEPALVDDIATFAKDALPLLEFGWAALSAT